MTTASNPNPPPPPPLNRVQRHLLASAWNAWQRSDAGQRAGNPDIPGHSVDACACLRDRLALAFCAGWNAALRQAGIKES